MSKEDLHLKEFVLFQLRRNVINLYKRYIILTEDLHKDHSIFLNKLSEEGVSENLLKKLDYFGDEKYTYIRKKILDIGNEVNRDLEKYFEIGFNPAFVVSTPVPIPNKFIDAGYDQALESYLSASAHS